MVTGECRHEQQQQQMEWVIIGINNVNNNGQTISQEMAHIRLELVTTMNTK